MPRFNSLELRLHIADFARSIAFYCDVLGFTVETMFPEENPVFAILVRDGVAIQIGGPASRKGETSPSTCTLYFDIDDVQGLHEQLKGRVTVEWGPEVYFYQRREFAIRDPDGHLVIFSEETEDPPTHVE